MSGFSGCRRFVLLAVFLLSTSVFGQTVDLRVSSISDTPDPVTLGTDDVTYTVNVNNNGSSTATNPVLTVNLPASADFVGAGASNSGLCNGPSSGVLTCNWSGNFLGFNGRSVTIVVTPTAGGTMTISGTITSDQPDSAPANDTNSTTTTVNSSIDLRVSSLTDSIDPITLGTGNVTYTASIVNDSNSKATNAKVDITLPAGATYVSSTASNSGTCSGPVGNILTCNWAGDLLAFNGRSATVTVTPTAGGTMNVSATVSGDQPEADGSDNTVSTTTTVNSSIDLRVSSISDSIDPITLGTGDVTYTVSIINDSTSKATNAKVDITLPAGATFVSHAAASGGTCSGPVVNIVTCNWAGDLLAFNGRSATVTVTPTAGGTMTLSATVSGDQPEADGSDNTASTTTTVNASIDLRVSSISDSIDPITLGTGNVTYTVNIINDSTSKGTNAKVDITLPSGATFVSHTASNSGTCSGPVADVVTCNWAGDLLAFNGRTATVTVTPTAGGTMSVSATVSGDQPEADGSDNTASTTTTVNASIDLRVSSVSDSIDPITLGTGNVTYTVNIINDSTSKGTNAKVDITLPAGATFVSHTASNSGTCSGPVADVVTCNWAGDLLAFNGRTATVTVTPTAGGTMTVSATVSGDQPEADGSDNTASTTTTVNASIDLRVSSVSDSIDPITLGTGNVTYTVNIINDSTSKGTNAKVDITLPAGATFVSHTASNSGTCSGPVADVVTCNWAGDLLAFNGRTATVTVTPTAGGTMTVSATVSGDQPEADATDNTASTTTTVNASIDLRVSSVSDSIDPITLGTGNVTYTIQIINDSTSKGTNAKVDITLPSGATFVSHTASNSGTCSGPVADVVTCNWAGDLLAFNGRTATVTVTPTAGGTMTTSATVSGDQPEADATDNTASTTTTVNATIDLQIAVTDSPDPRVLGAGNVTYTVNIQNNSTSKGTNPAVAFTLPSPVNFVSATPNSGGTCSGPTVGVLTCNWAGDLLAFNGRQVVIVVTPTNVGQLSATATVSGDQTDGTPGNNSETETTNINPSAPPTIGSFSPVSGPIGTTVTITGSNFFSSSFVKFNGVSSTFTVNSNTQITATVPAGATTGLIAITNASGTTSSASNFTVTPAPDLTIAKTASAPTVPTSTQILYTLAVSNGGAGSANDVTVSDTLPAGVTLNSVSGSGWSCSGNPAITCTRGALAPGSAPNITIDVTAPSTGTTVTNTATVSTSTPETSTANNSSSVAVGVVGCPSTPPIAAPATVCASSTGHAATTPAVPGGTYAWTITNGTITSSTTADTITFDAGPSGPVTLGVTVFVTACPSVSNSVNVAVSTPTATITPSGPTSFCSGGSVTLTANNGASYLWYVDGLPSGATTQSINVNGTGSFSVTVTDATGCSATSTPTNVTAFATPVPTITPSGPTTFCEGGSVTLTASAGVSYLWSNGATTQSINATSSETFTVTVNDGTCNGTSGPVTVTVNPTPTVSITHSGPVTFCDGGSVTLDAGGGFTSYLWSTGATTQTINVTASGSFTVTVTDANTCSVTSAPIAVTVNPNPTVTISGPSSACDSATLTADPGFASYLWSNGATTQSAVVTTTGSYTVTVTDANGCSGTSAPKSVTITTSPAPVITGPATACDNANLDAGAGYASYLWSNGATTQITNVTSSGTYSVTVTDANGCSGTDSHVVAIDSTPTATITPSGPTTFCDGGSVTLTSDVAASYLWSNGATTQSIVVSTPGTFTVTTTNGSCTAVSAPVTVTVNPLPTPAITGPATACDSANLDAGPGYVSYLWSNGATTQIANVTTSGTYNVTVTDGNGCSGVASHAITIETTPAATITPSGPTTFCAGGSVTLTAAAAATWNWSNGATTQSITVNASGTFTVTVANGACSATSAPVTVTVNPLPTPAIAGPASACDSAILDAGAGYVSYLWSNGATTQTINVTTSGTYSVTVTDANGCSGTDAHTIAITTTPIASITPGGPTTFCTGGSVTLTAGTAASYLWSNGATTQSINVTASGTFTVTVANGACSATSAPVTVTVNPLPTPTIAGPASACDSATLDAGAGYVSYLWSNGATTQTINVTASGIYSVTVTDANGCSGTDNHTVNIQTTPVANITASGPTSFCAGGSVTLTADVAESYLWSNGATTQSITVNASGTFTVTATSGSCSATSAPVTVTVSPLPAPVIAGPAAACDNATLDAGAGFASYLWSNGATTQTINVTASGTYSVTVTNAGGCSGTDTHAIAITATPVATITVVAAPAGCGSDFMLVASPGQSYLWSIDGQPSGATTQAIVPTVSGAYTVTVSNGSCSATSAPQTVNIPPPLSVTITGPADSCPGEPFTLQVPATFSQYLWSNGATTPSMTATVPGTYSVTVTGPHGCKVSDTHTVAPRSTPDANISAPDTVLTDSTGNVASVPVAGGSATYLWSIANGTIVSGQGTTSIAFQAGSSGTTTLTILIDTDDCSSIGTASVAITQSEPECATVPPSLIVPSANATVSSPVTFEWTAVAGAIEYELWINNTLANTTAATSVTLPVPPGPATWHVVARLAQNCPPLDSVQRAFTVQPPSDLCASRGVATLVAPANNSIVNSSAVEFRWQPVPRSSGYRVLASIDGAPPVVLGIATSEPSLLANLGSGVVDWSVETLFDGCASTESPRFRFTIPAAPNCGTALPVLIAPADYASTLYGNMMFFWIGVDDANAYELWLALDNGTPTLIGTTTGTSLMHVVAPGTLQWFVRALVDRCPPRDSLTRSFTFTPRPACDTNQRPVPIAPLPGAQLTSPATFSWSHVAGAKFYELFVGHGGQMPSLKASTTSTEATNIELANGAHRWFVRAVFGQAGDQTCTPLDSAEQKLVIVPRPPACAPLVPPVISAPGQISSGVELLIQWSSVPGATGYQLQLADSSDFANPEVIETNDTQHAIVRVNNGSAPLAVFARVRAIDGRCQPVPLFSPFGPASAFFILPPNAAEAGVPLTSSVLTTLAVPIGAEFVGQTFTASVKEPWLSVFPTSGVVPTGGMSLTVNADTRGLGVGTHLGTVFLTFNTPSFSGGIRTEATTFKTPTLAISKVTPVTPSPKSTPPPDALIIPAVAHAGGINSQFQSDVRVTNSSAQLLQYQVTFTPTGSNGLAAGRQTTFSIDPGRTIALDDVLRGWFGTGGESVTGSLEVRPLTQTTTSTPSGSLSNGLADLVTFASSRTFNVTANGTFGQYIPAIPFANFIGGATELAPASVLSLQQIAQSDRYRTNLGIVEGSGDAASLLVKVFGSDGQKLKEFPVNLAGGEHTQLNAFLSTNGVGTLSDGRVEISVVGGNGKVTAYASVLDNQTSDPLLVSPVTLADTGASKWVVPGVADLNNGIANWQTDMRLFNAGTADVQAALTFYSQSGAAPRTETITIPAGQVRQFDKALASVFGMVNDGGAIHVTTAAPSRLVATARTYNQTTAGTYGQFISGVTVNEAAGIGSRPLQILQVEESNRFRSNIGLAEVTGQPVKLELAIVPPDGKITIVTEVQLQPNEFRQIGSLLRSVGLADTYNARVSVRAIEGAGRVTAYASVIDMLTNDPTYVPAQ